MKIQIDGTNTLNKGAELMLYSVLEQIEKNASDAQILYNPNNYQQPINIDTKLNIQYRRGTKYFRYINGFLRRLGIKSKFFTPFRAKKIDILFDAGGFQFSDQWKYSSDYLETIESYYKTLKENGTKIIFLPQALGPFEKDYSRKCVDILKKYATLVYARENVSYNFIKNAGFPEARLKEYPDFTLLTKGKLLPEFLKYKGSICIIPNKKMITNTSAGESNYISFITYVIKRFEEQGERLFLLNHEGTGDLNICNIINDRLPNKLDIVSGLNALEVKGLIGESKLVISSRFHGVASALSQGIPCLATSWNHKYEMLFKEYGLLNKVFKIDDLNQVSNLIDETMEDLQLYRDTLSKEKEVLAVKINSMWIELWNKIK